MVSVETIIAALSVICVLIGLIGIVVPVLPGTMAIAAGLLIWAVYVGEVTTWVIVGIGLAILAIGQVAMYVIAGKRMQKDGVRNSSLFLGAVGSIIGMFAIPVVGVLVGFVAGVLLAEWGTHKSWQPAWKATIAALKAAGLSMLIELFAAGVALAPISIYSVLRYGW